jgi:Ser/Thr protein kinase RdoA (MazF antagonist)
VISRYQRTVFKDIASHYGLHVHRIKALDTMYKKNVAYRVSTDKGRFLIKAFSNQRAGGRRFNKRRLISDIKKLKELQYPHIAEWLTTETGKYYVNINNRYYYMTQWIKGQSLQNDSQQYQALGSALAKLHTLCKGENSTEASFTKRQLDFFDHENHLFRRKLKHMQKSKTKTSSWFREHGKRCLNLADEAREILENPEVQHVLSEEKKHPALIHGDVTIPNIVIHPSQLYLIDWDNLRKGSIYYEMAKTLSNTTGFKPEYMDALLQGYEKIKRLSTGERLLISALFRFPLEAWIEARNEAAEGKRRGFNILKKSWNDRLACIAKLDQWAHSGPASL